jgi:hypothetical protein
MSAGKAIGLVWAEKKKEFLKEVTPAIPCNVIITVM